MTSVKVSLPGFALFLSPESEQPVLDINGTNAELDAVIHELQAALARR